MNDKILENTLVRYRAATDKNIDALKNDRLYYSTPNNFNDPYDMKRLMSLICL